MHPPSPERSVFINCPFDPDYEPLLRVLLFTVKADAETLANEVRNWFRESGVQSGPPGSAVWSDFNAFMSDFQIKREKEGYKDADIRNMPVPEFLDFIYNWVANNCQ